ncbi:MAG: CPBP family intramembrane metalloprotease [Alphaproteobacteria bacterium]|nr:CPBP family intramembrane metalloprotease [Alphaproteobacteria bacterium]
MALAVGTGVLWLMRDLLFSNQGQLLAIGILYVVGFVAVFGAVAPLGRSIVPALALRGAGWRTVLLGVAGTLLLSIVVSQVSPELQGMKDVERIVRQPDALILSVVFLGILAPIVEELVFRGLLYGWLEGRWSWRPAFWISSLAFAGAHYQWGAEGWDRLAYALAVLPLGLLFGWLRRRSNSLVPSMAAHMANNSFAVIVAFFFGG